MTVDLHLPAGSTARDGWDCCVLPEDADWSYASLRVLTLAASEDRRFATGDEEIVILSLGGSATVDVDGETFLLHGRRDVFAGISDVVYAPIGSSVTVASDDGGSFALAGARATQALPARHVPATDVPVELRGAGTASRQVVDLCSPDTFPADRLIVCEVYTPSGNWSSYPPHKHDTEGPDETVLEEIYYFQVGEGPGGAGSGYQRVYASDERPIDVCAEVRSGDVVLVPYGWHGPSMASPGYDLYYLNVMAGPGAERAWRVCFDADHRWVMEQWPRLFVDHRLPLVRSEGGAR